MCSNECDREAKARSPAHRACRRWCGAAWTTHHEHKAFEHIATWLEAPGRTPHEARLTLFLMLRSPVARVLSEYSFATSHTKKTGHTKCRSAQW